jgi:cytochrome c oxidase subunit 4
MSSGEHGTNHMRLYAGVFVALLALTGITVWVALHDFGALNTPIALGIASLKASLVILYFMHVRWSSRVTWLFVAAGFFFLVILLGFTLSDYVSRSWLDVYGPPLGEASETR